MAHPLEPASAAEIDVAVSVYEASDFFKASGKSYYSYAKALEPSKSAVLAWRNGGPPVPRIIQLVGTDDSGGGGFQADVDVGLKSLIDARRMPMDAQVALNMNDIIALHKLVLPNSSFIQAIKKRGLTVEQVTIEPWPLGTGIKTSLLLEDGARIWRCLFFVMKDKTDNCYGRPIHGLIIDVNVNNGKVHVVDHGPQTMPPQLLSDPGARWDTANQGALRTDLKRIEIRQPDGVSFKVDGHQITWAGWQFRVGMHPINGLVLHDVSFRGRPILYRMSLSDMVVPYADADPMHNFKHVFDGSEPLIAGANTNSLKRGCDCLGEIHYFDMDYLAFNGKTVTVEHAICLHEEDNGIQWKTTDVRTKIAEVRRGRRLVVSSFSTVGNYDYGWYYYFHLDGEIEVEVKLTGIVASSSSECADPQFAPIVAPGIASPVHQHLFCFRLDWNLDGGSNSLYEDQVELLPREENPNGNLFRHASRLLQCEDEAKRKTFPEVHRTWKVVNRGKKNGLGKPVAYKVLQGAAPHLLAHDSAVVAQRAEFAKYNLWATPYTDGQLYAAGEHTVMSTGGNGLPSYTKENRSIVDCDLVTWHTIGATHVPRPEDWPVMPVEKVSFNLLPVGFFDKNPVMNLPVGECHATNSKL